jgi:hypothetical protein
MNDERRSDELQFLHIEFIAAAFIIPRFLSMMPANL